MPVFLKPRVQDRAKYIEVYFSVKNAGYIIETYCNFILFHFLIGDLKNHSKSMTGIKNIAV